MPYKKLPKISFHLHLVNLCFALCLVFFFSFVAHSFFALNAYAASTQEASSDAWLLSKVKNPDNILVSFEPKPFMSTEEAFSAEISLNALGGDEELFVRLELKDSSGVLLASSERSLSASQKNADGSAHLRLPLINSTPDPAQKGTSNILNKPKPGFYSLELQIELTNKQAGRQQTKDNIVYSSSHALYIYDDAQDPLASALVLEVEVPPLLGQNQMPNLDLIQDFEMLARQLSELIYHLNQSEEMKLTLSLPYVTLKDWTMLANLGKVPSPLDLNQQLVYKNLIEQVHQAYESGKLDFAFLGYSNPPLALLYDQADEDFAALQINPQTFDDNRVALDFEGKPVYAAVQSDLSKETAALLKKNKINTILASASQLDYGGSGADFMSAKAQVDGLEGVTFLQSYPDLRADFLPSAPGSSYQKVFETYLKQACENDELAQRAQENLPALIMRFNINGSKNDFIALKNIIMQAEALPWIRIESLDEVSSLMKEHPAKLTFTLDDFTSASNSQYYLLQEDALAKLNDFKSASSESTANKDLIRQYEADILQAQSRSFDKLGSIGHSKRLALLQNVTNGIHAIFASLTISTNFQQLKSAQGSVPIKVTSKEGYELNLLLRAQSNDTLEISKDEFIEGVAISTKAGANYTLVPIRVTKTNVPHHEVKVTILAGTTEVLSETIRFDTLRIDIILALVSIALVFIALIMYMRTQLRQSRVTLALPKNPQEHDIEDLASNLFEDRVMSEADDPESLKFCGDGIDPEEREPVSSAPDKK
ncbi:MAG: hypothetical protein Q4E22_01785 [Coriobacteriia bacterium]|nr:hypothetical protein [Coriobacteriia bacterium]